MSSSDTTSRHHCLGQMTIGRLCLATSPANHAPFHVHFLLLSAGALPPLSSALAHGGG
jgi:hypothetical protein